MAPKKRSASPGPKAKGKAAPKGKAASKAEPEVDPEVARKQGIEKEGKEMFEQYREDGAGVKLKGFADCIRAMNTRKLNPWTEDEVGPKIIKKQWDATHKDKEINEEAFVAWWPTFVDMVEAKVAEVRAEEDKLEEEKKAKAEAAAAIYDGDGVWNIHLKQLVEAIDKAYEKDKTPLIIDNTPDHRAETFFTYGADACIIECKKMIVDKSKGTSIDDILAEARDQIFRAKCFKSGRTLLFRMSNTAIDLNTFNSEVFPALELLKADQVRRLLGEDNAKNFKGTAFEKMCPNDEEKLDPTYVGIHEKFRVVCVTHFQEEDYQEYLKNVNFPLELCQPIKPYTD